MWGELLLDMRRPFAVKKVVYVMVKIGNGDTIMAACEDTQELANRWNAEVTFEFNGKRLTAKPGGSAERLVEEYKERTAKKPAEEHSRGGEAL